MGTKDDVVTIIENTIMEGTHKDPKVMASANIVVGQANDDNIDRLIGDVECNKEKMLKLNDNLVKMRG